VLAPQFAVSAPVYNGGPQATAWGMAWGVSTTGYVLLPSTDLTINSTHTNAGNYLDTWSFTDPTGNYAPEHSTVVDTIGQASLTISATSSTKPYDGTTADGATPIVSGLQGTDTVTGLSESFRSPNVLGTNGSTLVVNPGYVVNDGNCGNNYSVTVNTAAGTITPAPLTITPNNDSGTYGVPPPPGLNGVSYTGFVDGQTSSVLTTLPTVTTTATSTSPVGSYPITGTGAVDSNYAISYEPGTYTVTAAALTVTAVSESKTYGQTASLAYTENGLVNSDTITSVTETSAGAASTAPVGSDPIDISNAVGTGLSNCTVTYVNSTLTVTPATLTITATSESKVYEMTATLTYTTAGLVNGNKVTSVTETSAGAVKTANVGSYPIDISNAVGTGLSNYNINYVDGTLTVTRATANVVVTPYDVTYNGQPHTATGTVTGVNSVLPNSDLVLNTTHINAGVYTDTWTFSDPNYVSQSGKVTDIITSPAKANPPIALVTTLYQEILGRTPDQGGLACWVNAVNSGSTVTQIATSFWNSSEHKANFIGNLTTASHDASNAFVSALYHDVLGRAGDTGGITSWDQVLNSNSVTPNLVAMDFWNSSEHLAELKAGTATASTYGVVVTALYTELLGRSPDVAGLNAWVNIQYSGALTQDQMVQGFVGSAEFATRTSSLSTSQFVTFLYNKVLNRVPDAAGLAAWDQVLNSGAVTRPLAVQGFWDSPEHAQQL